MPAPTVSEDIGQRSHGTIMFVVPFISLAEVCPSPPPR